MASIDSLFTLQDTDRFAQWLGSTAVKAGFAATNFGGHEQPTDLHDDGVKATKAPASRTTMLRTDDFMALAKWIAQAEPPIAVPSSILACASRAVLARRKCANWFLSLTNGSEAPSGGNATAGPASLEHQNSSHLHFISVLESVISILSPLVPSTCKATSRRSSTSSRKRPSTPIHLNSFSPLAPNLNDTNAGATSSDDSDGDDDIDDKDPSPARKTQQQYRMAEDDDDHVDLIFIIHSYYADIQQVRQFVKDTWIQYRDGKIDLSTASLTTTCAVDLVREVQDDLYAALPAMNAQTCFSLLVLVYIQACLLRKEHPYSTDGYVRYNVANEDLTDFLMLRAAHLAMEFASLYNKMPGHVLDLPTFFSNTCAEWGTYDPLVDRSQLSARDKCHEDSALIMSISHFIHGVVVMDELPYPYLDAYTLETGELTVKWPKAGVLCEPINAFVTQVFLDIHHILRDRASNGFDDLKSTAQSIVTSLDAFDRFQYGNSNGVIHKNLVAGMTELRGIIQQAVFDDPFAEIAGQPAQFKLLKSHPWLCGLLQYQLLHVYQGWAISASIHWGSVPNSCHLYEAAKREGYVVDNKCIWPDMEFVMRMHTKEGMFRGKIPTNRIEAFNALQLVRGVPAVQMALATREMVTGRGRFRRKAGQNATMVTNRGDDHRPPEPCPLSMWLHPWFESCTKLRSPFMAQRVESGLLDLARTRHHTHHPHLQALNKYTSNASLASASAVASPLSALPINPHTSQPYYVFDSDDDRPSSAQASPGARSSRKLAPLLLLSTFRDALQREASLLQFDYWAFHLQCVRLHYVLDSALHPFLTDLALDRLHSPPVTIEDIIPNVLHFTSPVMRPCHPKSPEFAYSNQVLRLVFDALAEFVGSEGNTQVEAMRKRAKYVGLRAQVPRKDSRPPERLWHAVIKDAVDDLQQKWDRDVTPMEGLDEKLVEMVKKMESMDLAAIKLTVSATATATATTQRRTPPRAARPIR
ncbi:hypothetical protein BCR44DRAFT_65929 [Catenaria anguillulae PL171]|uniref:DUF6604 domain-containing protein n=1 Tax=Catenaria anguillulae PL171 TaxID=765915 RepID=A0A1Y2HB85_9FUNG|nr:hypothetical protein BCR44DRAFT_65929 [Catenaria anguillulae PL171]